jgi:hypothetical protein
MVIHRNEIRGGILEMFGERTISGGERFGDDPSFYRHLKFELQTQTPHPHLLLLLGLVEVLDSGGAVSRRIGIRSYVYWLYVAFISEDPVLWGKGWWSSRFRGALPPPFEMRLPHAPRHLALRSPCGV